VQHDSEKRLASILAETRQRGYGTREPSLVGGGDRVAPYDDSLATIAVALTDRSRVYGSINILWIKTAFTVEEFAARHLADLQEAAEEIVDALRRSTSRGPVR
jgi:IclR family mhp operon transcriptional activator